MRLSKIAIREKVNKTKPKFCELLMSLVMLCEKMWKKICGMWNQKFQLWATTLRVATPLHNSLCIHMAGLAALCSTAAWWKHVIFFFFLPGFHHDSRRALYSTLVFFFFFFRGNSLKLLLVKWVESSFKSKPWSFSLDMISIPVCWLGFLDCDQLAKRERRCLTYVRLTSTMPFLRGQFLAVGPLEMYSQCSWKYERIAHNEDNRPIGQTSQSPYTTLSDLHFDWDLQRRTCSAKTYIFIHFLHRVKDKMDKFLTQRHGFGTSAPLLFVLKDLWLSTLSSVGPSPQLGCKGTQNPRKFQ